jgi:serralysin
VVVTLGDGVTHGSAVGASSGVDDIVSGVTRVRGSEFNDIITGNSANNTLEGRAGNDVLDGRDGDDVLTGGTGADIFVYERMAAMTASPTSIAPKATGLICGWQSHERFESCPH